VGSTINARIEYRSSNQAQLNSSTTNSGCTAVSTAVVPSPLPLFGAAAAYTTSRHLRRRLRAAG
jgi:hypothetical protein